MVWLIPIIGIGFILFGIYTYNLINNRSIASNQEITFKLGGEISKALFSIKISKRYLGKQILNVEPLPSSVSTSIFPHIPTMFLLR